MINSDDKSTLPKRKPRKRKFYRVMFGVGDNARGFALENEDALPEVFHTVIGRRGFPDRSDKPRFLFDTRLGLPPRDLEQFGLHWLISDRMKSVLQTVDPAAFAFLACDVRFPRSTT